MEGTGFEPSVPRPRSQRSADAFVQVRSRLFAGERRIRTLGPPWGWDFRGCPVSAFGHCPLCEKGRRLCESEQGSESRFAPTSGRCSCGSSIGPIRYLRSSISARVVRAILISSDS